MEVPEEEPVEERGVPAGAFIASSKPLVAAAHGIAKGGRAFAQVVCSAEDFALDVLLGVAHLAHELAHGLRHGRQPLRPEEEQVNERMKTISVVPIALQR